MSLGMKESDFAFTVEARGHLWDCYRIEKGGQRGMLAFRQTDPKSAATPHGKWEIGFMRVGEFTADQVAEALTQAEH